MLEAILPVSTVSTDTRREPELSVVAPVYNEEDVIEEVVRYWVQVLERLGLSWEIVLGNDGSTDRTGEILARLAQEFPQLRPIGLRHGGYGHALGGAIRASAGRLVVTLDADGQFDLASVETLLAHARQHQLDFVTGYRTSKRDNVVRVFANHCLSAMVRGLFRVPFRDTNCALKLIRGDLARGVNIEAIGYPTPTEITVKLVTLGARAGECPVTHAERLGGVSKLRVLSATVSMLRFLWYLRHKITLYKAGHLQSL